jgi:putative FmdB family regulatory protein
MPEESVPTYQYRCTACNNDLEAVQSFTDASLTECPACSGQLRKVFGAVGVVFKGSGFYKTDSRAGGKSSTAKDRQKDAAVTSDAGSSSTSNGSSDSGSGSTAGGGTSSSSDSGGSKAAASSSTSGSAASAA